MQAPDLEAWERGDGLLAEVKLVSYEPTPGTLGQGQLTWENAEAARSADCGRKRRFNMMMGNWTGDKMASSKRLISGPPQNFPFGLQNSPLSGLVRVR